MDTEKVQAAMQSRTVRFAIAGIIGLAAKWIGLPMLPDDVTNEVVLAIMLGIDIVVAGCLAFAAWFRIKARAVIDRWFR